MYFTSSSFGCYSLITTPSMRPAAVTTCNSLSSGWLATFDTTEKFVIPTNLANQNKISQSSPFFFGLYKTSQCTLTGCNGHVAWDYFKTPASTNFNNLNYALAEPKVCTTFLLMQCLCLLC